jgi:hypothetical protein
MVYLRERQLKLLTENKSSRWGTTGFIPAIEPRTGHSTTASKPYELRLVLDFRGSWRSSRAFFSSTTSACFIMGQRTLSSGLKQRGSGLKWTPLQRKGPAGCEPAPAHSWRGESSPPGASTQQSRAIGSDARNQWLGLPSPSPRRVVCIDHGVSLPPHDSQPAIVSCSSVTQLELQDSNANGA